MQFLYKTRCAKIQQIIVVSIIKNTCTNSRYKIVKTYIGLCIFVKNSTSPKIPKSASPKFEKFYYETLFRYFNQSQCIRRHDSGSPALK